MFFLTDLDKEWPSCFVTVILPLCLWSDVVASLCCSTIFCDSGELETALSAGGMATSVTLLLSRFRRSVSRVVSWCHAQCHTCHVTQHKATSAQIFITAAHPDLYNNMAKKIYLDIFILLRLTSETVEEFFILVIIFSGVKSFNDSPLLTASDRGR